LKVALSGMIDKDVDKRRSLGRIDIVNTFITGYNATIVKIIRNKYVKISASSFFLFILFFPYRQFYMMSDHFTRAGCPAISKDFSVDDSLEMTASDEFFQ
jgi:hypothetical protein